ESRTVSQSPQIMESLGRIRRVRFVAEGSRTTGWTGTGSGTVVVTRLPDVTVFNESGVWQSVDGRESGFRNSFRWTWLDPHLRLEHLRFGADQPVWLFDLERVGEGEWRDVAPHQCREDCYSAELRVDDGEIHVRWT